MNLGPQVRQADTILDELLACGVRQVFLCPGNQSSPFAAALSQRSDIRCEYHFDERAAAFMALGYGKARQQAAAVICTSGTAVANLHPAVLEAFYSQTPLVLISADRPIELQEVAANQTCDQSDIFGSALRWKFQIEALEPRGSLTQQRETLRSAVSHACHRSQYPTPGPVHLNVRFRKPFISTGMDDVEACTQSEISNMATPHTTHLISNVVVAESEVRKIATLLRGAKRGLIVVGALEPGAQHQAIAELANKLEWPIWASVFSGMRSSQFQGLRFAHWYTSSQEFREQYCPDIVLSFGFEMVKPGNSLLSYIEQTVKSDSKTIRICVSEYAGRQDPLHQGGYRIEAKACEFAQQLLAHVKSTPSALASGFREAEQIALETLSTHCESTLSELSLVSEVCGMLGADQQLCIANSLPARFAEFAAPRAVARLVSNRGLSGIDGFLSTAIGAQLGANTQTVVVCGDLSFLHDISSLTFIARRKLPILIVLLNNDGGQIFSVVEKPMLGRQFEEFMCTPHGLQFKECSQWLGIEYRALDATEETTQGCRTVCSELLNTNAPAILEVRFPSSQSARVLEEIRTSVHQGIAAREVLKSE